jgi:hypothetical protein
MPFELEAIQQAALDHGVGHYYTLYDSDDARTSYHCFRNAGGYTNLVNKNISRDKTKIRLPWEFSFFVHPDDLAQAFEIVADELVNSTKGAFYFTVADPRVEDNFRKQMTLYTFTTEHGRMLQPAVVMFNHLRRIERAFVAQGIRMGVRNGKEYIIPGSQYIEMKYYPVDGSKSTHAMIDLVQLPDNPYQLFTVPNARLCVNATSNEVADFNAGQKASQRGKSRSYQPFTLSYLHAQAKINRATSNSFDAVPGYRACTYVQQGNYVNFQTASIPEDSQIMPWRFNFWVNPEDLETTYQVVSSRLLSSEKGGYCFAVLDPSIAQLTDNLPDQLTLYTLANANGERMQSSSDMYWSLSAIEKQLRIFNVRPGEMPHDSQMVNGSRYITMEYQPWEQMELVSPNEVVRQVNSVKNPYRMFGVPSSPLRIDYATVDEFHEAKSAYKTGGCKTLS